jgi:hypothetical protein
MNCAGSLRPHPPAVTVVESTFSTGGSSESMDQLEVAGLANPEIGPILFTA